MGGVVLNAQDRGGAGFGKAGGRIIGMQVAYRQCGGRAEHGQHALCRFVIETQRGGGPEIADMLGNKGFPAAGDAERGLQMAADAEHGWAVLSEIDGLRHEAARAPDEERFFVDHRQRGIIGSGDDGAVMRHDQVGDRGERAVCRVVVDDQRVARRIGAGGGQGPRAGTGRGRVWRLPGAGPGTAGDARGLWAA